MISQGPRGKSRNEYFPEIQYLRVLAITYVFIFHFSARRANVLPYGNEVEGVPWNLGWQGVYLFFIISGFVIAISLDACTDATTFMKNRVIRIYPALVVILPITYLVQKFIPYSEFSSRSTLPNLVSSIFLIPPTMINTFLGSNVDWLTLVLWSLKVEICFYLLIFVLRLRASSTSIQRMLPKFAILSGSLLLLAENFTNEKPLLGFAVVFLRWLSIDFLNWFVLGIILRVWIKGECSIFDYSIFPINLVLAIGLLNYHEINFVNVTGLILLVGIMVLTLLLGKRGYHFKNRIILSAGNSSYEMYLMHQGIGFTIFYYIIRKFNLEAISATFTAFSFFLASLVASYITWNKVDRKIGEKLENLLKT